MENQTMKLYTLLTGPDDETFCKRICEKLHTGWELYGSPSLDHAFCGTPRNLYPLEGCRSK
jgi:hypothetical protein